MAQTTVISINLSSRFDSSLGLDITLQILHLLSLPTAGPNDASGGGKQDGTNVSQSRADGQGGSAAGHGSGDAKIEGK